jgi:hypothetical protein
VLTEFQTHAHDLLSVWWGSENYISDGVHKLPPKSRRHINILDAKKVTWRKFHADDPQILGATVHTMQLHVQLDFVTPFTFTYYHEWEIQWYRRKQMYSSTHFCLATRREWSASSPSRFNSWESIHSTNSVGRSVCPRVSLNVLQKRKLSCLCWESSPLWAPV